MIANCGDSAVTLTPANLSTNPSACPTRAMSARALTDMLANFVYFVEGESASKSNFNSCTVTVIRELRGLVEKLVQPSIRIQIQS